MLLKISQNDNRYHLNYVGVAFTGDITLLSDKWISNYLNNYVSETALTD